MHAFITEASLAGFNPELEELALEELSDKEERNQSSDNPLSDTTDPEQARDVDELVNVGHPVFFNYAIPKPNHSLKVVDTYKLTLSISHHHLLAFVEFRKKLQHQRKVNPGGKQHISLQFVCVHISGNEVK